MTRRHLSTLVLEVSGGGFNNAVALMIPTQTSPALGIVFHVGLDISADDGPSSVGFWGKE